MTVLVWPCPHRSGSVSDEYAYSVDRGRQTRVLFIPALFDEANRLRRFSVQVMRGLDTAGIDSFLPDLPGTNESLQPLNAQNGDGWRAAMAAAATHFGVTHVVAIRGGCLFAPDDLPTWHYAPVKGASLLRQMMRARILVAREAGRDETQEMLLDLGQREGLELSGFQIGPAMLNDLQQAEAPVGNLITVIEQGDLGGSGLWLRAEPGEAPEQSKALAAIIIKNLRA